MMLPVAQFNLNWALIELMRSTVKWKGQLHFREKVKGKTATLLQ